MLWEQSTTCVYPMKCHPKTFEGRKNKCSRRISADNGTGVTVIPRVSLFWPPLLSPVQYSLNINTFGDNFQDDLPISTLCGVIISKNICTPGKNNPGYLSPVAIFPINCWYTLLQNLLFIVYARDHEQRWWRLSGRTVGRLGDSCLLYKREFRHRYRFNNNRTIVIILRYYIIVPSSKVIFVTIIVLCMLEILLYLP